MSAINFISKYGASQHLEPFIGKDNDIVYAPTMTPEQYARHVKTAPINGSIFATGHKNEVMTGDALSTLYHRAASEIPDDFRVVGRAICHDGSPKDVIMAGFSHPNEKVRSVTVVHSLTKLHKTERVPMLHKLATDPSSMVRMYVAKDDHTPIEALHKLSDDSDMNVGADARATINRLQRKNVQ